MVNGFFSTNHDQKALVDDTQSRHPVISIPRDDQDAAHHLTALFCIDISYII